MQKYIHIILGILIAQFAIATETIKIMSYNALLLHSDPKEIYHDVRRTSFLNTISSKKPAIIGLLQVPSGSDYLENALKPFGYQSFGDARNITINSWYQKKISDRKSVKNERNPIFYDTEKLSLVASGNFGINPVGYIFNASFPRICTWGLFEDKETKQQFYIYNTQLSNVGWWGLTDGTELIRIKQMNIIFDHIAKNTDNLPVIIMGDIKTEINVEIKNNMEKALFKEVEANAKIIHTSPDGGILRILVKKAEAEKYNPVEILKEKREMCAIMTEIALQ